MQRSITICNIEIKLPYTVSTNSIYSGAHWNVRKSHKRDFGWAVKSALKNKITDITQYPVNLSFEFKIKSRLLDSSNTSYMGKLIEDWLVEFGILKGDSPRYVSTVSYQCSKGKSNVCNLKILGKEDSCP